MPRAVAGRTVAEDVGVDRQDVADVALAVEKVGRGAGVAELGGRDQNGLTVRVVNENVEIDLTDEAISDLIAEHLLPRFRAIMRRP